MASPQVVALHYRLSAVLERAEKVLQEFGVGHWKLSLVARNPDPNEPGQWVNVTNDDPAAVAKTPLTNGPLGEVIEPDAT